MTRPILPLRTRHLPNLHPNSPTNLSRESKRRLQPRLIALALYAARYGCQPAFVAADAFGVAGTLGGEVGGA